METLTQEQTGYSKILYDKLVYVNTQCKKFREKGQAYFEQSLAEKDREKSDLLYDKYLLYIKFSNKCYQLLHTLRNIDYKDNFFSEFDYKARLDKKARRKLEFETKHTISVMFMQTSLTADYGKWQCQKCSSTFYHSPSEVNLGIKKLYDCVCGHCVNKILIADDRKPIFN